MKKNLDLRKKVIRQLKKIQHTQKKTKANNKEQEKKKTLRKFS